MSMRMSVSMSAMCHVMRSPLPALVVMSRADYAFPPAVVSHAMATLLLV